MRTLTLSLVGAGFLAAVSGVCAQENSLRTAPVDAFSSVGVDVPLMLNRDSAATASDGREISRRTFRNGSQNPEASTLAPVAATRNSQ